MSNASSSVTPKTTSPIPSLFDAYANLIAGEWELSFSQSSAPTASAAAIGPFVSPSGGSLTAARILGGQAVEGAFSMGNISGKVTVVKDGSTGKLKQTTVNSDGTTSVATIESGGGGQWIAATACAAAAGAVESSTDIITVSAGGETLTHRITNRRLNGQPEPDLSAVFTRKSNPVAFGATQGATAIPLSGTPNLLDDYAGLVSGQWTAKYSSTSAPTGALSPGFTPTNGSFAASRILGGKAVEGTFNLGAVTGKWTAVLDNSTGQIKQSTVNSDGSTVEARITSVGGGMFKAEADCPAAAASVAESSTTIISVSDWGNTMTQHMTNRVSSDGTKKPDLVGVFTRVSTIPAPVPLP